MNKMILIFCLLSLVACGNSKPKEASIVEPSISQDTVISDGILLKKLAVEYDSVHTLIRDGKIYKATAQKELQERLSELKRLYFCLKTDSTKQKNFIFPLAGYSPKNIGGTHGEGYVVGGYDYFKGNNYHGHPAHDIFIYDRNQDCIDDNTKKPAYVLSATNGIVIALALEWDTASNLKGGKYIWIYDVENDAYYYYAHNEKVLVELGQIVSAGDTLATVGRTGLNAYKQRSPTHLHFMKLVLDKNFYPKPVEIYQDLLKAKIK